MQKWMRISLACLLGVFTTTTWSEEKNEPGKNQNPALRAHVMQNIDVLGKGELPAIYILGPKDEEIDAMLLTRDFSRDPFFMQNIDREEFETKMTLRDVDQEEEKKEKVMR